MASNALSGYSLYGSLNDGSGNARLANGSHYIISGLGENTLSFDATNSGYNSSHAVDADSIFQGTPTLLSSHSTTIGHTAPTNIMNHTIYYNLNVDYSIPAGSYSGNITYTAIGTF